MTSLTIILLGWQGEAVIAAGFFPARMTGLLDIPPEYFALPAFLTPLSATLIHGGLIHLISNLVIIGYVAPRTEEVIGARGLILLYVVGAFAAAFGQWLASPESQVPMVGASGAASAVLASYALFHGNSRARAIGPIPAPVVQRFWLAGAWIAINLIAAPLFAQAGMPIAAAAHIGGFVAGLLLARPLWNWHWRHA